MKKIFLVLLTLTAVSALFASQAIYFDDAGNTGSSVMLNQSGIEKNTVSFTIHGCTFDRSGDYDIVKIEGLNNAANEEGLPALPIIAKTFAMPDNGVLKYKVNIISEEKVAGTYNILPLQKPLFEIPGYEPEFVKDDEAYTSNRFYPIERAYSASPAVIRDVKFERVFISPFRYNPVTGELYVITEATFETWIDYSENDGISTRSTTLTEEFVDIYRSMFDNFEALTAYKPVLTAVERNNTLSKAVDFEGGEGDYLIVVAGSDMFEASKTYAHYKAKLGYKPVIFHVSNYTAAQQVRDTIRYAYNNWSTPPVYVLLIGDADSTLSPATNTILRVYWKDYRTLYSYGVKGGYVPSDHWVALMTDVDYHADVFLSRFNVKNTTLFNNIADKTIKYETDPDVSSTTWFTSYLGLGAYEDGRIFDTTATNFYKKYLQPYGWSYWDSLIESSSWTPSQAQVSDSFNDGHNLMLFRGHGAEGWDGDGDDGRGFEFMGGANNSYRTYYENEDIAGVTNGYKGGFVFAPTCLAGNFAYLSSVADSSSMDDYWCQINPTNGGPGYFGATNVSLSYYNDSMSLGIARAISNYGGAMPGKREFAKVSVYGKEYMETYAGTATYFELESHLMNTLGDPAVVMWTKAPQSFSVSHDTIAYIGTQTFTVTVGDGTKAPVVGALVCLYDTLEIPDYYHATALTDASGVATFITNLTQTGNPGMNVTVTKQDYIPYMGEVRVDAGTAVKSTAVTYIAEKDYVIFTIRAEGYNEFDVYRNNSYIDTWDSKGTDRNLTPDTEYSYKIVGITYNGQKEDIGVYSIRTKPYMPSMEYVSGVIKYNDIKNLSVFDITGRKMQETINASETNGSMNVSAYPAGIYIAVGDKQVTKFVIVK